MKTTLFSLFIIASLFMVSCNSSTNKDQDHSKEAQEQHAEGDGHDHGSEAEEGEHADEIAFTAKQAEAAGLTTETVSPSSFRHVIKTSGQVQAPQGNEQTIAATSSGIVSFVNPSITDGIAVRAGEAIVTISAKNLQEGDPAIKAKIAFETAQKEYQRAEKLVSDKIISAREFEQTKSRYMTAKTAYEAQAANVTTSGIRVPSPINGYLKNRLVSQGDYVSIGQPIATVTQNRHLQLRAEVSDKYFKDLQNISSANFKTTYDPTIYKLSEMNGKLLSYGKTTNNESFYIPVTFEFNNVGHLVPGTFAEIYLLAAPRANIISVPVSALTDEQGVHYIYLQVEPEAFIKQEVTVGQNNGERVEITKGLQGGEKVVITGVTQVKLASASGAIPEGHNH